MKRPLIFSLALAAAMPLLVPAAAGRPGTDGQAETRPVARRLGYVPFDLNRRPMPAGRDLEKLLPKRVGEFTRPDFAPGTIAPADEDIKVKYTSGEDSVLVGFSIPGTALDAQEGIRTARREAFKSGQDLKDELYSVGSEPSYFRLAAFMAWSRGGYFFYAGASGNDALGRFMHAFPF